MSCDTSNMEARLSANSCCCCPSLSCEGCIILVFARSNSTLILCLWWTQWGFLPSFCPSPIFSFLSLFNYFLPFLAVVPSTLVACFFNLCLLITDSSFSLSSFLPSILPSFPCFLSHQQQRMNRQLITAAGRMMA